MKWSRNSRPHSGCPATTAAALSFTSSGESLYRSPTFEKIIQSASAPNTAISNEPRMTPAVVEIRMSRYVSRNTNTVITSTQIHHWPL